MVSKLPKCFFNFRWNFQRTFLTSKKCWQLDTIKRGSNKKRKTRLLLAAMEAFVDLKSESVEQTRSKNMTIRHTSRRAVAPTVVQSSDSKGQLPPEVRWLFCRLLYSTVVGLHDIAGDVYHQSIITFPAPVSGIDIHIGSEHWCFSLETLEHRYHIGRFSRIGRTLVNWSGNAQHSGCSR